MFTLERTTDALKCSIAAIVADHAPHVIVNYKMHMRGENVLNNSVSLANHLTGADTTIILPFPANPNVVSVTLESLLLHNMDTTTHAFELIFTQDGEDYVYWNDTMQKDKALIINRDGTFQFNPS